VVYYSYAPIFAVKAELVPHLNEYYLGASPRNADSRLGALWVLQALSARTGLPVDFPVRKTEHGRPYFEGEGVPDFNLSHAGHLAACALGTCRVGIDIEEERDSLETEKLAARYFSEREQALLQNAPRPLFFELWTKKEALGKYLGEGLTPLLRKDTDALAAAHGVQLFTKRIFLGGRAYTLSVCTAEPPQFIKI